MDFVFQRRKGGVVPDRRWMEEKDDGHPERDQERTQCRENNQRDSLLSHAEEEMIEVK